jgi:hypothetical protein
MTTSNTTVTLPLVNARKVDGELVNTLVNNNDRGGFTLARSAAGGYVLRSPAPRSLSQKSKRFGMP